MVHGLLDAGEEEDGEVLDDASGYLLFLFLFVIVENGYVPHAGAG